MAGRKEYEMLFQLNAQLGGSYSKTFKAAQQEIVSMQKEIQALQDTGGYFRISEAAGRRGSNAEAAGNAAAAV